MITRLLIALTLCACSPAVYMHGVPNLDKVDDNVYRSGQIQTQEGWDYIAKLANGRKVHVLKLNFDNEGSDDLAIKMGFEVVDLAIQPQGDVDYLDQVLNAYRKPDPARVDHAQLILRGAANSSSTDFYLVHCTHGQDRTGLVVGEHRVLHDGWTKGVAYDEMLSHHFHPELHGVHEAWEDFHP